jgi:hypothetical protein
MSAKMGQSSPMLKRERRELKWRTLSGVTLRKREGEGRSSYTELSISPHPARRVREERMRSVQQRRLT